MKKSTTKSGSARKRSTESTAEVGASAVTPNAVPIDEYNAIVNAAELLGVHLMQSRTEFHPEQVGEEDDDLILRVAPPQYRGQFSPETGTINCGVRLTLTLEKPTPETPVKVADDAVVEVFAEYRITYKLPENTTCEERIASFFASRNALFNAWPFFRELAFSLVGKMGMPPVVTPLLRLPPLSQAGIH